MNIKQKLLVAASSATIALAGFAAIPAHAGQLSEWIGQTEDRLLYVMGAPTQKSTNPDGSRVLRFVYQQTSASSVDTGGQGIVQSLASPKSCQAEFVIGENGHVKAAKFVGQACDIKKA